MQTARLLLPPKPHPKPTMDNNKPPNKQSQQRPPPDTPHYHGGASSSNDKCPPSRNQQTTQLQPHKDHDMTTTNTKRPDGTNDADSHPKKNTQPATKGSRTELLRRTDDHDHDDDSKRNKN